MCTRILWNDNGLAVVTARTMDWPTPTEPVVTVFPRGSRRDGGLACGQRVIADNALTWEADYGSVVTSFNGAGTVDGVNERGLAAHLLFLSETDFGARDPRLPGLHAGLWAQYLLDRAATVEQALELLAGVQVVMMEAKGTRSTVHLALEDAAGDSAIVEYLGGASVAHHGPDFRVMTNSPPYDQQLELLAEQDFSHPSSDLPLPGNVNPRDRFQRASYFAALLPKPRDERAAVAGVLSVARSVSVPFGAPYRDFGIYDTEYRTVCDLTSRRYFFELTTVPSVIWADLGRLDLSPGAPVLTVDPDNPALAGDITGELTPASAPY